MTFTPGDIAQLRGILYSASQSQVITKSEHDLINDALLNDPNALKGNASAYAAAGRLVKRYPSPLTDRLLELTKTDAPAPTMPTTPEPSAPDIGVTLTDAEIKVVRDINYAARKEYQTDGSPMWDRFIAMTNALGAGTYKQWMDPDRGFLLSMMAKTSHGLDSDNRKIIDKFAAAIGVTIRDVPAPGAVATPPTAPTPIPTPSPAPDVTTDSPLEVQMRAYLEKIGVDFAGDGSLSGFKLASTGAPEGKFYGYVGANDFGLRLFSGIRAMIGKAWPNVDVNPNSPVIMGPVTERDGVVSWDISPPLMGEDPNPRPNKTFGMVLAGFLRGRGPRGMNNVGKYLDFGTFEAGRGVRWFTRRTGSATPDIDVALHLDPDNGNAVAMKLGGQLRRVTVDPDGRLIAGEVVSEDQ